MIVMHIAFSVSTDRVESKGGHGRKKKKKRATAVPPLSSEYMNLYIILFARIMILTCFSLR